MKYVYQAIFTPTEDGFFEVEMPDLPGCFTFGENLTDAVCMAQDAASMWLWDAENKKEVIPEAKELKNVEKPRFISYIYVDTDEYRRKHDNRAVKKTLSIPNWLNAKAEEAGINFSQTLQGALKEKLNRTASARKF